MNSTFENGVSSVSGDELNSFVQWCPTVAELRDFIGLTDMAVYLEGLSSLNDGGQGMFIWVDVVTQPDDGQNYIVPTGASGGGWVRLGPPLVLPVPAITGALSAVTDANAKAVMTSIIAALTALGLTTNGTS